ncbi:MAG: alpha-N-arabinofuranosidase [Bryobacterales bacterium]|nr:alpha-N-arabinofuranosidase [Bryobacterales bacterium]MBV9397468.1 alpha-N-arabinofuranosidase [Bryobacterales bacterium]
MKNLTALSRRSFSKVLIAGPWVLRGQQAPPRAHIKIDTERVIDDIDPKIYGNFAEHLGRCIEGGIFAENSPLSDANGYRRDVLDAAKKLGVSILRWPGGNFSSNYHWKDGIGPRDKRPPRLEMAWGTVESNRFGTHEFLNYCEMLGTEPYICANLGTGTWEEAQQWVEYVNSSQDTAMTRLRKENGRGDPWKVTYWGLGNEIDGPWQMGHRSAEDYGKFALEAAKLMKWTDPNIKLIAAGSSNYTNGIDWIGWNRTVLDFLKTHADYLSLHMYVGNTANDFGDFLADSLLLNERIKITEGVINGVMSGQPRSRKVYIAWDEWNVWYRARGNSQRGRNILEERYNLEDALVVATFLNTFVNNAHIIKIANMAQLVNVIAPIFTDEKRMFLQTIYYPLALFANNTKGKAMELLVKGPTYPHRTFGEVPHLDASAALDDRTLVINVVNRHRDQPVETDIELEDKQFSGPVEVSEVNAGDIKAENSFDSTAVKTVQRSTKAEKSLLRYSFPPHSYTMLKATLA